MTLATYDRLISSVEAGVWDHFLFDAAFDDPEQYANTNKAFHNDMNAALSLKEALLPGWFPGMSQNIHSGHWYAWVQDDAVRYFDVKASNPARAWLLSILRAHRHQIAAGGE